jgi:hypothetical protein
MAKMTFYPIGNADCILIDLDSGKKVLFDYAACRDPDNKDDLRCDLPAELRNDLGTRDHYDIVAFTHLDRDHYQGATEFFYFRHIKKYQSEVDEKPRIKMGTMWVPAAVITEALKKDADVEAKAIQQEARDRFRAGERVRVFSRPERLREWCEANKIDFEKRKHLITDAGKLAPEVTLKEDGAEFFVHSPFAKRQDENTVEDRNRDAIIMQVTFQVNGINTKAFLSSDAHYDVLADIVTITEAKGNGTRLEWDIHKLPHHCSYRSLAEERGKDKTTPDSTVGRLFEDYGSDRCIVVSNSDTIPKKGDDRDMQEGANPPHRQAASYYREDVCEPKDGEFKVTMEHPNEKSPKPLVIEIGEKKAKVKKMEVMATAAVISQRAPRAG